ncbi:MAG: hypothetical protein ACFCU3_02985 [Verrucomicrobiales bacterium]
MRAKAAAYLLSIASLLVWLAWLADFRNPLAWFEQKSYYPEPKVFYEIIQQHLAVLREADYQAAYQLVRQTSNDAQEAVAQIRHFRSDLALMNPQWTVEFGSVHHYSDASLVEVFFRHSNNGVSARFFVLRPSDMAKDLWRIDRVEPMHGWLDGARSSGIRL